MPGSAAAAHRPGADHRNTHGVNADPSPHGFRAAADVEGTPVTGPRLGMVDDRSMPPLGVKNPDP